MEQKILLNKAKSKKSNNVNMTLPIQLKSKKKNLDDEGTIGLVNLLDVYNTERTNCDKIRLTVQVNPICSNILFNYKTEIVKGEGSSSAISLTFADEKLKIKGLAEKNEWENYSAITDTQLSNSAFGFSYNCGLDIFDNHILRKKVFKSSVIPSSTSDAKLMFNTLYDYARDNDGYTISGYNDNGDLIQNIHLYTTDDIMTFQESIENNLYEENGWFGFSNKSQINTFQKFINKEEDYNGEMLSAYDRVINSKNACTFIDMYPGKDYYTFNPYYNKYRNRLENNWNYCLTYPYSSITEGIEFINNDVDSLKSVYFYEYNDEIRIFSLSKHNLSEGDYINIYVNGELKIKEAIVSSLGDAQGKETYYVFSATKGGFSISDKWHYVTDSDYLNGFDYNGVHYIILSNRRYVRSEDGKQYPIIEKMALLDDEKYEISYKKIINGIECEYYVRLFTRLPNWKYSENEVSEYNVYDNDETIETLKKAKKIENTFESHITPMCFARNSYNDRISQIIFTDDIGINSLHDNLGRPLSEIYLTIIKNNAGYKDWYGKYGKEINISAETIEHSHCFGKLSCAFELCKQSISNSATTNIFTLNNVSKNNESSFYSVSGMDMAKINANFNDSERDSIEYSDRQDNFYGDLCEYRPNEFYEYKIQDIGFRFNTAQREICKEDSSYKYMGIYYTVLATDDFDYNSWSAVSASSSSVSHTHREGYYYNPHYRIDINTFSNTLQTGYGTITNIRKIIPSVLVIDGVSEEYFKILTLTEHNMTHNEKFILFDKASDKYYDGTVVKYFSSNEELIDSYIFYAKIDGYEINSTEYITDLQIMTPSSDMPSYARAIKDGTARYAWRELEKNGYGDENKIETYPFSNGRIYINKNFNIYLKRQDPFNNVRKYSGDGSMINQSDILINVVSGNSLQTDNNYTSTSSMTC